MLDIANVLTIIKKAQFTGKVVLSFNQGGLVGIKEIKERDITDLIKTL